MRGPGRPEPQPATLGQDVELAEVPADEAPPGPRSGGIELAVTDKRFSALTLDESSTTPAEVQISAPSPGSWPSSVPLQLHQPRIAPPPMMTSASMYCLGLPVHRDNQQRLCDRALLHRAAELRHQRLRRLARILVLGGRAGTATRARGEALEQLNGFCLARGIEHGIRRPEVEEDLGVIVAGHAPRRFQLGHHLVHLALLLVDLREEHVHAEEELVRPSLPNFAPSFRTCIA